MAELIVTEEAKERVVLIGIQQRERDGSEESLTELGELLKTAGAEPVGRLLQLREAPDPGTYFGKGKVEELRELLLGLEADAVAADDELSPAQMKNLSEALGVKIMDRTMIILDIFAQHAVTAEGKLQVELAQLHYTQAHLRRCRHPGTGRAETGARPPRHSRAHQFSARQARGVEAPPGSFESAAGEKRQLHCRAGRLYECRQVDFVKPAHRRRHSRGK